MWAARGKRGGSLGRLGVERRKRTNTVETPILPSATQLRPSSAMCGRWACFKEGKGPGLLGEQGSLFRRRTAESRQQGSSSPAAPTEGVLLCHVGASSLYKLADCLSHPAERPWLRERAPF